jgi:hypothetical protein
MNPLLQPLIAALIVAGAIATSATAADRPVTKADLPPPPGMNDPRGSTPATATAPAAAAAVDQDPLAPLPKPDARLVRDKASRDTATNAERVAASDVTRRQQGDDTVEEYRQNGHVWMIKILPQNGPTQTFLDPDGSGRLARNPNEGPVSPVYYSLYEWK